MNELGMLLIGCIVRCTVLAAAGLALGALLWRRGPAAGSLVSLTTLTVLLVVPFVGMLPWPRWWTIDSVIAAREHRPASEPPAVAANAPQDASAASIPAPVGVAGPSLPQESWLQNFAAEFERELRRPLTAEGTARWGWPAWVAMAVLATFAFGLIRLLLGLRAVSVLRRWSTPIEDPDLIDALELCRAEMSCVQPVTVLESAAIATPATVGWSRPAILLPATWRDWDEQERRVVLAHELAHIGRRDYVSGLLAQLSVALHFYHPMAHWLAARLRLQQELAADAWGARIAGGPRPYVTTLAQMALRQAERPLTWPIKPLLPTRGTFLRRLEMLRDEKRILHAPLSRRARALTISTLLAAGLVVTGFRGPDGLTTALAQEATARKASDTANPLAYVPADAALVITARPADVLTDPDFAPISAMVNERFAERSPVSPSSVTQVTVFWLKNGGRDPRRDFIGRPAAVIARTSEPQDLKKLAAKFSHDSEEVAYQDRTYYRSRAEGYCFFAANDRTFLMAEEVLLRDMIKDGPEAAAKHSWDRAWNAIDRGQLTLAVDTDWFRTVLGPKLQPGQPMTVALGSFAPIWEKTRTVALGVNVIGGLKVDALATCEGADDAKEVGDTLRAVVTLARNTMRTLHQQARTGPGRSHEPTQPILLLSDLIDPLLDKADVKVEAGEERSSVRLRSETGLKVASVVKSLMPPIAAARAAASRAQGMNNLKQIGLAFHNYASANGHFPPAAVYAPNSKYPHSWRVALLPYLEQAPLYNQYRFDEPWDSENNRKLIDQMPAVFRDPAAAGKGSSPSYFVLTGPNTIFGNEKGTGFASITDGTSNTILVVSAKRDIPWTKPEDIRYDPQGALPALGGFRDDGLDVLFADGSVRVIPRGVDQSVLRALISMDGGEVISPDALDAGAGQPRPTAPFVPTPPAIQR